MQKERLFTNRQLLTLLWPLIIEQMLEILVAWRIPLWYRQWVRPQFPVCRSSI